MMDPTQLCWIWTLGLSFFIFFFYFIQLFISRFKLIFYFIFFKLGLKLNFRFYLPALSSFKLSTLPETRRQRLKNRSKNHSFLRPCFQFWSIPFWRYKALSINFNFLRFIFKLYVLIADMGFFYLIGLCLKFGSFWVNLLSVW